MIYLYNDVSLSSEVSRDKYGNYLISVGPTLGYDGVNGSSEIKKYWLQNRTGISLTSVVLTVTSIDSNVSFSTNEIDYSNSTISFGQLVNNGVASFTIKVNVAAGAAKGRKNLSFTIEAKD